MKKRTNLDFVLFCVRVYRLRVCLVGPQLGVVVYVLVFVFLFRGVYNQDDLNVHQPVGSCAMGGGVYYEWVKSVFVCR